MWERGFKDMYLDRKTELLCVLSVFRMNDVIVKVNDDNVVNVTHAEAVDALKRAGTRVVLVSVV